MSKCEAKLFMILSGWEGNDLTESWSGGLEERGLTFYITIVVVSCEIQLGVTDTTLCIQHCLLQYRSAIESINYGNWLRGIMGGKKQMLSFFL